MSTFLATNLNLDKKISKIDTSFISNFFIVFLYDFHNFLFFALYMLFLERGMPESCINFSLENALSF